MPPKINKIKVPQAKIVQIERAYQKRIDRKLEKEQKENTKEIKELVAEDEKELIRKEVRDTILPHEEFGLTESEYKFCQDYISLGNNATKAYLIKSNGTVQIKKGQKVTYSSATTEGTKLRNCPDIKKCIGFLLKDSLLSNKATMDMIIKDLMKIANTNRSDIVDDLAVPPVIWDDFVLTEYSAAIKSIKLGEKKGKQPREVKQLILFDKMKAIDKLENIMKVLPNNDEILKFATMTASEYFKQMKNQQE